MAFKDAQKSVIRPTKVIVQIHPCDIAKSGVTRATKYNPAFTIVAECRYALTGVGASIASGNQI